MHTRPAKVFVILLAITVSMLSYPSVSAAGDACGMWHRLVIVYQQVFLRWSIKTASDPDASRIRLSPVDTTVGQLRSLSAPGGLAGNTPRQEPVEFTVYRVRARLVEYHEEGDQDFHVVIAEPNDPSQTMIAEIPDPACPGASSSRLGPTMLRAVRQNFIGLFGQPPTREGFRLVPGRPVILVTGVGFFDKLHGQRGVAPNGIELHPVLDVRP